MSNAPKIRDYMTPRPVTVHANASIEEAFELMGDYGLRHLPVERDRVLVGVISDRDIAKGFARGHARGRTPDVAEVMTPEPYTVDPDANMSEVLQVMAANRLGCVVVKNHGGVAGIFTTTDAVRLLARTFERR